MTTYLLVVVMNIGGQLLFDTEQFATKALCEQAKASIYNNIEGDVEAQVRCYELKEDN